MSIAFIITGLGRGGAELSLLRHIKLLKLKNRAKVFVLGGETELSELFRSEGIDVISLDLTPFNLIKQMRYVKKVLDEENVTIVDCWMYHAMIFGIVTASNDRINLIWNVRNGAPSIRAIGFSTYLLTRVLGFISNLSKVTIVFNSKSALKAHVNQGFNQKRSIYLPNSYRFKEDLNLSLELRVKTIGFIGRNHPEKNPLEFIRVAKRLIEYDDSLRFTMRGAKMHSANITRYLTKLSLLDYFEIEDLILNKEFLYSNISLLIVTSLKESFPNVLIEAISEGIVCFALNVGDCKEILDNQRYPLVYDDVDSLICGVSKFFLLSMEMRREILLELKTNIKNNYSSDNLLTKWHEIYEMEI